MEPEGSLPHSQEPATCPYPEPAQSSSCPHIPLPEYNNNNNNNIIIIVIIIDLLRLFGGVT
jgi:hypothetical protein